MGRFPKAKRNKPKMAFLFVSPARVLARLKQGKAYLTKELNTEQQALKFKPTLKTETLKLKGGNPK